MVPLPVMKPGAVVVAVGFPVKMIVAPLPPVTVKVAPGLLKKGGRVSLDTPFGRRAVWIDRKAAERGLVRLEGQGLPARGARSRGHLFLRLAAAQGLADSAALALLRRFAAAWAA